MNKILYGTGDQHIALTMEGRNDRKTTMQLNFEGVIPNLERRFRETQSEYIRNKIGEFMSNQPCPTCKGERLRPEALAVTVLDHNIVEVTRWPVNKITRILHRVLSLPGVLIKPRLHHCRKDLEGNPIAAWVSW